MKILFISIVLLIFHNSWGQQNENTTSVNTGIKIEPQNVSHALLKSHTNQWLNETKDPKNATLQKDLFWKLVKLTESYLRQYHHVGNASLASNNAISGSPDIEEILKDDVVSNMLQYYQNISAERNYFGRRTVDRYYPRIKNQFSSFWNTSLQQFKQWWNRAKGSDLQVNEQIQKIKKIGAKLMTYFPHLHRKNGSITSTDNQEEFIFRNRRLLFIEKTTLRTYSYLNTLYVKNVRKMRMEEPERFLRFLNNFHRKKARKSEAAAASKISTTPLFVNQKLKKNLAFSEWQEEKKNERILRAELKALQK